MGQQQTSAYTHADHVFGTAPGTALTEAEECRAPPPPPPRPPVQRTFPPPPTPSPSSVAVVVGGSAPPPLPRGP